MKSYDYQHRKGVRLISWEKFHEVCKELAEKVVPENVDLVLGVARSGLYAATLVSGMLRKQFVPLYMTRRENDQVTHEKPVWLLDISEDVAGKTVLVVDDISDSGETLRLVMQRAQEKGAARVISMALAAHTWSDPMPDYCGMRTDELVIFPWDTQIWVNGAWQLHPELQAALRKQGPDMPRTR